MHGAGAQSARHRAGRPPWEIGLPQPAFVALAESGAIRGRVLDVGCGTGEHVLLAARLGLDVTGLDIDEAGLQSARRKAAQRGLTARFVHGDARRLGDLAEQFDTVLDCELFHALTGADRDTYLAGLRSVVRPGGRYFMLCYSNVQPDVPHRVRREDIVAVFADGWRVDSIEPVTIDTDVHPRGVHGWLAALTRTAEGRPVMTAYASIETERASRYLVQLCEHLNQMTQHQMHSHDGAPPTVERVEWSDNEGTIEFGCGRCRLAAAADTLTLSVDASDPDNRQRIQDMLTRRLQTIGRRDDLKVTWR